MPISRSTKPRVCITAGYPAGIGPEIILKTLASPKIRRLADFLVIGDISVFEKAAKVIGKRLSCRIIDAGLIPSKSFRFGITSADYGRASIDYIRRAVSIIKNKEADLLVTAPISKHCAELSGFKYPGHTEYLAHITKTKKYAMMLTGAGLKVVLATTHLPIKDVPGALKKKRITDILVLTNSFLKKYYKIRRPRIAVCGLNPHAGDDGMLGKEEKRVISPAIKEAKKRGVNATNALAADGLFYDLYKKHYDAALCMYHDQGLVALKMVGRDNSVNITMGLPFIRTSPGHGTALDIAGKNIASFESMKESIITAVKLFKNTNA